MFFRPLKGFPGQGHDGVGRDRHQDLLHPDILNVKMKKSRNTKIQTSLNRPFKRVGLLPGHTGD